MPRKEKTETVKTVDEKVLPYTKIIVPLVDPVIGERRENAVYVTKTSYEKGMEEYLAGFDSIASLYVSVEEFSAIFGARDEDNPIRNEFTQYSIDRRRRVGEVCGYTSNSVVVKVPTTDPAVIEFVKNASAVLRFYWDGKKDNPLELKKGTFIHVIEVAIVGPSQMENQPIPATEGEIPEENIIDTPEDMMPVDEAPVEESVE